MFFRRALTSVLFSALFALPFAVGSAACGGPPPTKVATVKAADMPEGGEWTGVYYDQTNGYLHLVKEGDTVSGKWRTTAGDAWGELSGKVTGNLLKYEWKEHRIGMVGPSSTRTGRGYFSYTEPKAGEAHEINGEFGLGMDETGMKWKGVKQLNMKPDPESVMPDEVEGRMTGGGWDDEGKAPPSGGGEGDDSSGESGGDLPAPVE